MSNFEYAKTVNIGSTNIYMKSDGAPEKNVNVNKTRQSNEQRRKINPRYNDLLNDPYIDVYNEKKRIRRLYS